MNQIMPLGGGPKSSRPLRTVIGSFSIENRFDEVDAVKISGDSDAADNLELQYDGTGIVGDKFPSTQEQLANLSGGLALGTSATASTVTQGAETNTFAATATHDGTSYIVTDSGSGAGIDFFMLFNTDRQKANDVFIQLH